MNATRLSTILKLLSIAYPAEYRDGINPVLFIYDDESGKILKNAIHDAYENGNCLFHFSTIDALVEHLREKAK